MGCAEDWKQKAVELNGKMSWRKIAQMLGVPKSSCSDFLRKIAVAPPVEVYKPRVLFFDLETAPTKAYIWKRWKENISQAQVLEEGYILTYSAKWKGDTNYIQGRITSPEDDEEIVKELAHLINQADLICAHNLLNFDFPLLKTRMVYYGLPPLKPVRVVDTLQIAKKEFRFPSNSLDSISSYLGIGRKTQHSGFDMWKACMDMQQEAFDKMLEYNGQDVFLLEEVYDRLANWYSKHPNMAVIYDDGEKHCPLCGSTHLTQLDKPAYTQLSEFVAYQCECGKISRARSNVRSKEAMKNTLTNVV